MIPVVVILVTLTALAAVFAYELKKHRRCIKLYLVVSTPTITVKDEHMQIQIQLGDSHTLGVSVVGSKSSITNVPVAFSLANPDIADLVFDQAAMTLAITAKAPGVSDLVESYGGVSNTHSLTVTDVVVSVDLFELPTAGETPVPVDESPVPAGDTAVI